MKVKRSFRHIRLTLTFQDPEDLAAQLIGWREKLAATRIHATTRCVVSEAVAEDRTGSPTGDRAGRLGDLFRLGICLILSTLHLPGYREDRHMTVGIKDIARLCGVSTATVSRALSHPERVSEATRNKVLAVIASEDYRVNSSARNLRRQRTDTVLAVARDLGNPFFSQIFRGLQEALAERGRDLLVFDSDIGLDQGRPFLAHLRDGRADGLVCLDSSLPEDIVAEMRTPELAGRIVFACEWLPEDGFASIRSDNRGGMELVARHLVELGHRRIAYVRGPKDNVLERDRNAGLSGELSRQGLALEDRYVCEGWFDYTAGQAAAPRILAMAPRPTAVVCASDTIAIGLISALSSLGVRVPQDLSVTGFDDIAPAPFCTPPLTTIRQERRALGAEAGQMLMRLIAQSDGQAGAPAPGQGEITVLPVTLIPRGTTAPPT